MTRLRLVSLLLLGLSPGAVHPGAVSAAEKERLTVFAAASLLEPFTQIARGLERQRPGLAVRFNFAGSQLLATQLEQGAAADVFASADERWMLRVEELSSAPPTMFARNRLVVIVPRTNPARIARLQDLARRGVKLVIGAAAVPVGRYSRQMLANLEGAPGFEEGFARRALANVVSEEENVKSVVGKVQLGEADAGIVYQSDVTPAIARLVRVFEIPVRANVIATYLIAPLREASNPGAATAFIARVLSPEGQRLLERAGLLRVSHIDRDLPGNAEETRP